MREVRSAARRTILSGPVNVFRQKGSWYDEGRFGRAGCGKCHRRRVRAHRRGVPHPARPAQRGDDADRRRSRGEARSEEPTSELQSLMRISYAVFCLQKKTIYKKEQLVN